VCVRARARALASLCDSVSLSLSRTHTSTSTRTLAQTPSPHTHMHMHKHAYDITTIHATFQQGTSAAGPHQDTDPRGTCEQEQQKRERSAAPPTGQEPERQPDGAVPGSRQMSSTPAPTDGIPEDATENEPAPPPAPEASEMQEPAPACTSAPPNAPTKGEDASNAAPGERQCEHGAAGEPCVCPNGPPKDTGDRHGSPGPERPAVLAETDRPNVPCWSHVPRALKAVKTGAGLKPPALDGPDPLQRSEESTPLTVGPASRDSMLDALESTKGSGAAEPFPAQANGSAEEGWALRDRSRGALVNGHAAPAAVGEQVVEGSPEAELLQAFGKMEAHGSTIKVC
jgi:hypothetical protein